MADRQQFLKTWRGFWGLRTYTPELRRDLEELNTFLLDLRANVGKLVQGDPTSGDDTVAVLLAGTGLYKDPANTVNIGNNDDTLILTDDAVAVNQDFDFVWTGLHTFSAGLRFGPLGGFYTRFNQGSQSGDITYTLPVNSNTGVLHNSGGTLSWSTVSLTTDVTDILPIANGGTNATATPTAGGIAYGTGSAYAFTSAGTSGDWLRSTGAGAPAFTSPAALTKTDDTNVTLTLGGSPTTALLNAASLTLGWTGQLAIARGGTAASTALGAFNNLSPLTTRGDLLTRDASNNIRLGIGASGTVLRSDGTDPAWTSLSGAGIVAGTGTLNTLAKWTSASTLGDSLATDDGFNFRVTGGNSASGGGFVTLQGGDSIGPGSGGDASVAAGSSLDTGTGGTAGIIAGAGGVNGGSGGGVSVVGGSASPIGSGGDGGAFSAVAGDGIAGPGGAINMFAGSCAAGTGVGGDVVFRVGLGNGAANGTYQFFKASGAFKGILDFESIATSSKTFTFPNLTGTIALTSLIGGGTNASLTASNGGIVYSNATQFAILAGTATAGQILRSGASAAPSWSTATFASTYARGDLVYASTTNVVAGLTVGAAGTYLKSDGTDPSWATVASLGANPTASVGLTAVNGSAATFLRSDGAPALDQTISPTWTGTHTFNTNQDVHNAGISLGTSGRINSAVADAASAISIQYKPSVALTSGTDRRLHSFEDSAGTKHMAIMSDGTFQLNGGGITGAYFIIGGTITAAPIGISFEPTIDNTGSTIIGVANTAAGGRFIAKTPATINATSFVGGVFASDYPSTLSSNITRGWGGWFRSTLSGGSANSGRTWTEQGGWKAWGIPSGMNFGTITDYYGGYVENACASALGSGQAITNARGLYIEEQTRAGTINNGIFLANATAGYKAIAIRDQNTWIGSSAAATLDLQATTVLVTADHKLSTAGNGYYVKEGTNATMGTATANGTTAVTVNTTKVTANSRIFLTTQVTGGTPGALYVDARTGGTSFNFKSTNAGDTSTVAWLIVEPA